MKTLWILAAAATFAACHNRSDDTMGAAPDRGDTTSTSGYDSTAAKPSMKSDTAMTQPAAPTTDTTSMPKTGTDTSMTTQPTTPSTGYDTTSTTQPTSPSTGTVRVNSDSATTTTTIPDSASTQR